MLANILQTALNRYLDLDPESKKRLHKLQNKIVTIELLGPGLIFQLSFDEDRVQLNWDNFAKPDTYIKGSPLTLLHLSLTKGDRKQFFSDDVSIEGNLDLGQDVIDLFDHLDIDWEEYLSHCIGDVSAHQVGRFVHGLKKFNQRVYETLSQNVNEYIHEEVMLFPPREALQDFFTEVDELRMDVDRMEAKVMQLKNEVMKLESDDISHHE